MTILHVNVMWAVVLLGVTLWTTACCVMNPALRALRWMGLALSYAAGLWMALTLPWREVVVTWCVFAAVGGALAMAYELWARRRYLGTGRRARPLVLLQGFVLWPVMLPEVAEGVLVDAGILRAAEPGGEPGEAAGQR